MKITATIIAAIERTTRGTMLPTVLPIRAEFESK
jgi:hypothetical protein